LITREVKDMIIPEFNNKAWVNQIDFKIPENTDIRKSFVEVIISNNRLTWIDKIVSSLARYPYWCIEQTISSTLPNAILLKFGWIFDDLIVNKKNIKNNTEVWIKRLESMQLKSGWFAYWDSDDYETNIRINSYVLSSMLDMKSVYKSSKLGDLINNSMNYLSKKFKSKWVSESENIDIYMVLSKAWRKVTLDINSDNLNKSDLLKYTYWLYYSSKIKFSSEINRNILRLKDLFRNSKKYSYNYSNTEEKALFTSLLIDLNKENILVEETIWELYSKNWSSYYHSTKTKNIVFNTFLKYLQKHFINKETRFSFSLW
jgi:hypothetical protein